MYWLSDLFSEAAARDKSDAGSGCLIRNAVDRRDRGIRWHALPGQIYGHGDKRQSRCMAHPASVSAAATTLARKPTACRVRDTLTKLQPGPAIVLEASLSSA